MTDKWTSNKVRRMEQNHILYGPNFMEKTNCTSQVVHDWECSYAKPSVFSPELPTFYGIPTLTQHS